MSESDFKFHLKNNVEAIYANLNRRKEFFITVQNITANYIPQVRVKLTGPPSVKLLVKSEWYGGMASGRSKNRLFTILPKENGNFNMTATLVSKKGHLISLPVEVRVGQVEDPILKAMEAPKVEEKKIVTKVNCPYCHEKIDEDAKFCPHCGSSIGEKEKKLEAEAETQHCTNCGTELPVDAKFCAKCGQNLK